VIDGMKRSLVKYVAITMMVAGFTICYLAWPSDGSQPFFFIGVAAVYWGWGFAVGAEL